MFHRDLKEGLRGRDFLTLHDYSTDEIEYLLDVAVELKKKEKKGEETPYLKGKTLGLLFEKASTRTRVSFEVGMYQLGGYPLFLSSKDLQLGRGETVGDTARVLSRYVQGVMVRTFSHRKVELLAEHADVPVINGLTDLLHPCQALADLLTIREKKEGLKGLKLAYLGDGNNVAHSLLFGGAKTGMNVAIACPPEYRPQEQIVLKAKEDAAATGAQITIISSIEEALRDADVVYTDVWTSMGQEEERNERLRVLAPYQVNQAVMKLAREDAIFMHCLPAHRGEEVTDEVIDGPSSVVFDQAENRLHAQKAILALLMG